MTQSEVAEKSRVNQAEVSSWETGRVEPNETHLKRLAKLFGDLSTPARRRREAVEVEPDDEQGEGDSDDNGANAFGEWLRDARKAAGLSRKLVAFVMEGRGTARHGYTIYAAPEGGSALGIVTSGSLGPTVGKNIGLGYVPIESAEVGQTLYIDCRGKRIAAQIVKSPFYRRSAV